MSATLFARGGRLVVFWRALREVEPLLRGYIRLARAETGLAAASVKGLALSAAVAILGLLIALIAGVAVGVAALLQTGMAVWQVLAWFLVPSLLVAIFASIGVWRGYERLTLPQTRKRVRMLFEIIDEDR